MHAWLVDLLFLEQPSCVCQRTAYPVHFSTLLVLHVSCPACVQHTAGSWSCPLSHDALHCIAVFSSGCLACVKILLVPRPFVCIMHCIAVFSSELYA